jgi:hypothetical protein
MDDDFFNVKNPSKPLLFKGRMDTVAEEQAVGGHFEGESERERKVGVDELVVVDVFQRSDGTHYLRVSLRNPLKSNLITRAEADLDRHTNEADFLKNVTIMGGALAEDQCERHGAVWDCENVAKEARRAGALFLNEIKEQS